MSPVLIGYTVAYGQKLDLWILSLPLTRYKVPMYAEQDRLPSSYQVADFTLKPHKSPILACGMGSTCCLQRC